MDHLNNCSWLEMMVHTEFGILVFYPFKRNVRACEMNKKMTKPLFNMTGVLTRLLLYTVVLIRRLLCYVIQIFHQTVNKNCYNTVGRQEKGSINSKCLKPDLAIKLM